MRGRRRVISERVSCILHLASDFRPLNSTLFVPSSFFELPRTTDLWPLTADHGSRVLSIKLYQLWLIYQKRLIFAVILQNFTA
jgi:hypothetical protein